MPNTDLEKDRANKAAWRKANPNYHSEYYLKNKKKIIDRTKAYSKSRPEWRKQVARKSTLKRVGWTAEEFTSAYERQNGLCAICHKPETKRPTLSADHDHSIMKPRELLCQNCNAGLGMMMDSPSLLEAAACYLRKHGK